MKYSQYSYIKYIYEELYIIYGVDGFGWFENVYGNLFNTRWIGLRTSLN